MLENIDEIHLKYNYEIPLNPRLIDKEIEVSIPYLNHNISEDLKTFIQSIHPSFFQPFVDVHLLYALRQLLMQ